LTVAVWAVLIGEGVKMAAEMKPALFAGLIDRYMLYCESFGASSPEDMECVEREWEGPGRPIYLLWLLGHLREWKRLQGRNGQMTMTDEEHAAFDAWLRERVANG
jgi:hypothetical protein